MIDRLTAQSAGLKPCLRCGKKPHHETDTSDYGKRMGHAFVCECGIGVSIADPNRFGIDQDRNFEFYGRLVQHWNSLMTEPNFTVSRLEGRI